MALSIDITRNVGLTDAATNNDTSTVGEPSIAANGDRMLMTGNWYASRSTDGGSTWTWMDPVTTLPSAAGGFCCDQLALFDRARGIWIWILQYRRSGGTNVFRIAVQDDAEFTSGAGWHWWDIAPATVDDDWSDLWFDYPDASLTSEHLYVTFNMFRGNSWQRATAMRFPLDTLQSGGSLGFGWWTTTELGSLRLTQQATPTDRQYFVAHRSRSRLQLTSWRDGSSGLTSWDIDVRSWNADISSTAPSGVDWLSRCDTRITGATLGDGVVTVAWTAGSQDGRPNAYCRVVQIDESDKSVKAQPDIFSTSRAWAYPALSANDDGTVGFTAFYGGGDRDPGHVVGLRDEDAGTWRSSYARLGSDAPGDAKWGDYLNCRADGPTNSGWVASGFALEGGAARTDIIPRVVRFRIDGDLAVRLAVGNFGYAAGGWRVDHHPRMLADTTGDGRQDIVGFGNAGVYVSRATGGGAFSAPRRVVDNFGRDAGGWRVEQHPRMLGDTTGDGRADIVGFGNAGVYVSRATSGGSFTAPRRVVDNFGRGAGGWRVDRHPRMLADTTGDGRADIVGFGNAGVYVSRNNGDGTFADPQLVVGNFGYTAGGWRVEQHPRVLADTTGDGRADIVGFGNAGVYVSRNNGDGTFADPQLVVGNFGRGAGGWRVDQHPRFVVDVTGDGRADIVGFGNAGVYVSRNNGDGTFGGPRLEVTNFGRDAGGWSVDRHPRMLADMTGDGRPDIVGFGYAGMFVSRNNGDGTFRSPQLMVRNYGYTAGGWRVERHPRLLGDVTGDGTADVVGFGNAGAYVSTLD